MRGNRGTGAVIRAWSKPVLRLAGVGLLAATALAIPPAAGKAPQLEAFGGSATAVAIGVHGETNAFAGMPAEFNIPFAHGMLESSPTGEASSAVLDTGPLGATVVSLAVPYFVQYGSPVIPYQPQYATSRYPAGPAEAHSTGADISDPSGISHTDAGAASAKTSEDRVESASRAAGLTFSPPAGLAFPGLPAGSSPDVAGAASSEATMYVEATAKGIASVAESITKDIDVLGGLIHFDSVHSVATVLCDGKAPEVSGELSVDDATIAGVPVTIGAAGVSVAGTLIPGGPEAVRQAQDALDAALAPLQMTMEVLAVTKTVTKPPSPGAAAAGQVVVGGLRISWVTPAPTEGTPQQTINVILGGGEAEAHAVPAVPASAEAAPTEETAGVDTGGYSAAPEVSSYIPEVGGGNGAGTAIAGSAPQADLQGNLVTHARRKDWLLILVYLLWQVAATAVLVSALRKRQAARMGSR